MALSSVVYVALAEEMLRHSLKLGGHPDQVLKAVDGWYQAAAAIDASTNEMFDSFNELGVDWEGPAYSSYQRFMERNIKLADGSFDALIAAAMQLVEAYKHVVKACTDRNTKIAQAFVVISDAGGLWMGNGTESDVEKAQIKVALQTFAVEYTEVKNTLMSTLANYRASVKTIQGHVLAVSPPGEFPGRVLDRKKWKKT